MQRTTWFPGLLLLISVVGVSVAQQKPLTNEDILKMVAAGLGPELIESMISTSPCQFQTDVDSILRLKEKQVPESVIQAMLARATEPGSDGGAAPSSRGAGGIEVPRATPPADTPKLPDEVGVYYRDPGSAKLHFIEPELVNWKTGGFWKRVGTVGLNKGHVNGIVDNPSSRYQLTGSEEILIRCLEGTSGTEYQLLNLWEKDNSRSFRAVTGGIVHSESGTDKNLVYVEPRRVAPQVYKFNLPGLPPGEYGLLPPFSAAGSNSPTMGKIYAFTVKR